MRKIFFRGAWAALPIVAAFAVVAVDWMVVAKILSAGGALLEAAAAGWTGRPAEALRDDPAWAWFFAWGSVAAAVLLVGLPLLAASAWMATGLGRWAQRRLGAWLERVPVLGPIALVSRALSLRIEEELVGGKHRSVAAVPWGSGVWGLAIVTGRGEDGDSPAVMLLPKSPVSLGSPLLVVPAHRALATGLPLDQGLRVLGSWGLLPPRPAALAAPPSP